MSSTAIERLRTNVHNVFYGNNHAVDLLLIGLLARGHVLIEDVPGVGKTLLAKALAKSIACDFSRIQLTPDLLPGDVLGVSVFNRERSEFEFKPGPVFTNILLADEINRTTPRTQSALLEAMSEEQVSVENHTYPLKRPFMVIATQNPFEFEGTYHLPENQLDRFILKVSVGYPSRNNEQKILVSQPGRMLLDQLRPVMSSEEVVQMQDSVPSVKLDSAIVDYILDLAEATRHHDQLHLGISTRGALALTTACQAMAIAKGRNYVLPDDVKELFIATCAHRVISKTYLGSGDADATAHILKAILDRTQAPK